MPESMDFNGGNSTCFQQGCICLLYTSPEMVPTNYHGEKMGLGNYREENIEVILASGMEEDESTWLKNGRREERIKDRIEHGSEGRIKNDRSRENAAEKPAWGMRPQCSMISMKELVEQYGNPHFNVDRTKVRSNIWTKLAKALNIFQKKPYIEADKCVRCGICVNSCPVPGKAVDFRNGKKQPPVYDYKKCIRCFCCQEMCPKKAIKVK